MFIVVAAPAPVPVSVTRPVPGYSGHWCRLTNNTRGIVLEHRLGAVAVVGVVVEHPHPLALVGERGGDDGDVGHQAEPHRVGRRGVMARRADGAERRRRVPVAKGGRPRSARHRRRAAPPRPSGVLMRVSASIHPPPAAARRSSRSRYQPGWTRSRSARVASSRHERHQRVGDLARPWPRRPPPAAGTAARDGSGRSRARGRPRG